MNPLFSRPLIAALVLLACCAALVPVANAAACDHPVVPIVLGTCQKDNEASESKVVLLCTDSSTSPASQPIDSYYWGFMVEGRGGLVPYNYNKNARFEFAGGRIRVDHQVGTICSKTNLSTLDYTFYCNIPVAGFTVDRDSGTAPLTVRITDTSQHTPADVTTWQYRKDNVQFSNQRNPAVTFSSPGTYTITQMVKKSCSPVSDAASRTIKVKSASGPALVMSYVAVNMSGVTIPTTTTTTEPSAPAVTTTTTATGVVPVVSTTVPAAVAPAVLSPAVTSVTSPAATGAGAPGTEPVKGTPGTGTLSVVTNPAGAQVFVDDVMRGLSPANIPGLPAGEHMLRLEKSGYGTMRVPVSIESGKTTDYSTGLEAESGGMGMLPVIAGVLVIAAGAGSAYWYTRKKGPGTGGQA
ncbi:MULTISPECIES: PEGA domain-containing protein [unclassified Methanoregula]|uniref:PEGA domain-containing protein n=1 Tax=unclassified Methanoregula TaxID=2649730 RepID=UPI0025F0316B|nr:MULTISPECIES: PEGA domain-containing protein [unclassified Methanoregula]